jgi:hypothetical protein
MERAVEEMDRRRSIVSSSHGLISSIAAVAASRCTRGAASRASRPPSTFQSARSASAMADALADPGVLVAGERGATRDSGRR